MIQNNMGESEVIKWQKHLLRHQKWYLYFNYAILGMLHHRTRNNNSIKVWFFLNSKNL